MCSQIHHSSSLLPLPRMSGNRQISPLHISDSSQTATDEREESEREEGEERENLENQADHLTPEEIKDEAAKRTISQIDLDEGYETPTSSDHRIPPITQCPPPPMKPRPAPSKLLKRKLSPPSRSIQLEVESMFSPIIGDDAQQRRVKRARTADDEDRS